MIVSFNKSHWNKKKKLDSKVSNLRSYHSPVAKKRMFQYNLILSFSCGLFLYSCVNSCTQKSNKRLVGRLLPKLFDRPMSPSEEAYGSLKA